ncbi:MAG: hypothetical protein WA207_04760, partial [Candidatus Acidiferrum sp.]
MWSDDSLVIKAGPIWLKDKPLIERLASVLDGIYKKSGEDFSGFRSQLADPGDGIKDRWVLLD